MIHIYIYKNEYSTLIVVSIDCISLRKFIRENHPPLKSSKLPHPFETFFYTCLYIMPLRSCFSVNIRQVNETMLDFIHYL